ncbi:MAG: sigma-70 family RNA polymerase sigma factor [bacterium]|nr:sigma-70 family RNA polymerase sigma factor [bacterium]
MASNRERLDRLSRDRYRSIFSFFLRRGFPRTECYDLTQETFYRAMQGLGGFRDEASETTWLFRIARNLWLNKERDRRRLKRRRPEVPIEKAFPEEQEIPDRRDLFGGSEEQSPEERLLQREQMKRVRDALEKLPTQRRRCLVLRLEELKYREIADLLGISLQAVRSHLSQARQQMRELLGDEIDVDDS